MSTVPQPPRPPQRSTTDRLFPEATTSATSPPADAYDAAVDSTQQKASRDDSPTEAVRNAIQEMYD